MQALYQPIVSGKVRDEDAEAFGQALLELPGPVFAYCPTGTRSATLASGARSSVCRVGRRIPARRGCPERREIKLDHLIDHRQMTGVV